MMNRRRKLVVSKQTPVYSTPGPYGPIHLDIVAGHGRMRLLISFCIAAEKTVPPPAGS
jgi:hypothetical protein